MCIHAIHWGEGKINGEQQPTTQTNKQANTTELSQADSKHTNVIINNNSELTCLN